MKKLVLLFHNMCIKQALFTCLLLFFYGVSSAQPVISSFSPVSGSVGISVTITGSNFSTTAANNLVYFGPVRATVTAATASSLTVTVPAGANFQPISVTVAGLTAYAAKPFIVTFPGGGQLYDNSFALQQDFTTDLRPNAFAVADFDGDGKTDLATPNNYSTASLASVSVLRNTSSPGAVSFATRQDIVTDAGTYAIAAADVDGDGKLDIISSSNLVSTISVFRNISTVGTISFAPRMDFASPSTPFGIVAGDIDGDGKTDLAVLGSSSQVVSVYRNTGSVGNVSFAPRVDFSTQLSPYRLAIGDLDGDGKVDIACTNELSNSVSVFRNTSTSGTIAFAARVDISAGAGNKTYGIAIGDMDGDGKSDMGVVTGTGSGGGVQFYRNTGTAGVISFALNVTCPLGTSCVPFQVAINDINGDGKPDFAVTVDSTNGFIRYHENTSSTGNISFGLPRTSFSSFAPYGVTISDLDNDSRPDLAITEFTLEKISVFKNQCGAPVVTQCVPGQAGIGQVVTITGLNFTGTTAVKFGGVNAASFSVVNATTISATLGAGASGNIEVTNAFGTGLLAGFVFATPPTITSFTPTSAGAGATVTISGTNFSTANAVSFGAVPAASFAIVSATTITAVIGTGASGNVSVTNTFGTGSLAGFTFIGPPVISSFTPATGGIGTVVTINGTGFTGATAVSFGGTAAASFTVVNPTTITATVAGGSSGSVSVTTAQGTGSLAGFTFVLPPAPVIISFSPLSANVGATVTINGSNFNTSPANNIVYFGATRATVTAASATQLTVTVPAGATYRPISVLNTATNLSGSSISQFSPAFPNGGIINNQSFPDRTDLTTDPSYFPNYPEIADLDGDGKPDIIFGQGTNHPVGIFRNTSPGGSLSFAAASYLTGFNSSYISIADIDGDGKKDLVGVVNNLLAIRRNISVPGTISFAPVATFLSSVADQRMVVTDLNNDGRPDIVLPFGGNLMMSVVRNTSTPGSISLAAKTDFPSLGGPTYSQVGDLDGDNNMDIVISYGFLSNNISVYRNNGTGGNISFAPKIDFATNANPGNIAIGDLDGDNKNEICVSNLSTNNFSIYRNTGSSGSISFAPKLDITTPDPTLMKYVDIGDVDGDGRSDLIIGKDFTSPGVFIYKNNSTTGNISLTMSAQLNSGNPWSTDLGDMDADGRPDLVLALPNSHSISLFKNKVNIPLITSFSPIFAGTGTTVTITGNHFIGATAVSFGGTAATSFTVVNATTITAVVAGGATGAVSVTTPTGTASRTGFTYVPPPTLISFSPTSGPSGTVVTLTGTNFTGVSAVSFGGTAASSFTPFNSTTTTAIVGAGSSGNVSITAIGGSASLGGFTYISLPAPVISSFTPTAGGSGTVVTITGTNFNGATAVSFGGTAAASYTVVNPTTITATVGAGASGNVSVTTPGGTGSLAGFSFVRPPTISSFTPTGAGTGSTITISGTNFTNVTAVNFGGANAGSYTVVNANTITAVVGAGASGLVIVTNIAGVGSLGGFTYYPTPTISSFNPLTGTTGAIVTITGTNFTGATQVSFGGTAATSFTVVNATTISAVIGNGASGVVTVITPGGTATLAGFTFSPVTAIGGPGSVNSPELTVSPNPVSSVINIKHPASSVFRASIEIYDALGRQVSEAMPARGSTMTLFNTDHLSSGVYIIKWRAGTRTLTRLFLKQ